MHSLDNTSKITFKQYCTMIKLKKYSYIERKQKELHLLLKNDQILFGMSFEEKKQLDHAIDTTRSNILLQKNSPHDQITWII